MKIIVAHSAPDLDAITSVWLIKRFLPDWQDAIIEFVPAGGRMLGTEEGIDQVIQEIGDKKIITVDTGMGPLDHHQTSDREVCAAKRTLDYVAEQHENFKEQETRYKALQRIVDLVIDTDHFQDVYFPDSFSYRYDFQFESIIDGYKMENPQDDLGCVEFVMSALDKVLLVFEGRVFAEQELEEKAIPFDTPYGKAVGVESVQDALLKLAQLKGYVLVVRKDPRLGFVRIKARPEPRKKYEDKAGKVADIDLTPAYKAIRKMDPDASWFLHVSKKMLLNGSSKNPTSVPTKLSLTQIIEVIKETLSE